MAADPDAEEEEQAQYPQDGQNGNDAVLAALVLPGHEPGHNDNDGIEQCCCVLGSVGQGQGAGRAEDEGNLSGQTALGGAHG